MPLREAVIQGTDVPMNRARRTGHETFRIPPQTVHVEIRSEETIQSLILAISRQEEPDVVGLLVDLTDILRLFGPCGFQVSIRGRAPFYEEVVRGITSDPSAYASGEMNVRSLSSWGLVIRSPYHPESSVQLEAKAFAPMEDEWLLVQFPNRLIRRMEPGKVYEAAWALQDVFSRQMTDYGAGS